MIGIYKIENLINHQCYIGQSIDIERRWKDHRKTALSKIHNDIVLYRAINKYGINNFLFSVIEECEPEQLNEKEIYYIQYFNSFVPNGYNATLGGQYAHPSKITPDQAKEIQDLLENSFLTQEEIADKYNVSQRLISSINQGETWLAKNKIYPLRKDYYINHKKVEPSYCIDCGKRITTGSIRCPTCAKFIQRKVERPSREQLKQEIRTMSFTTIGKKYGVTDNAIRKWCDSMNLPRRVTDIKAYSDKEWEKL